MKFDKYFVDGTTQKKKVMIIVLLVLGITLTVIGLIKGIESIDPKYFVLIASLVGLIISGFAIGGKLYQDIKSGKNQQAILDTTIVTLYKTTQTLETATNNFSLTQNIDSTTTKTQEISIEIDKNVALLKEQNAKIEELNKAIDKKLVSVKEINVDQTKEIEKQKFPLPDKFYLNIELSFKWNKKFDYNGIDSYKIGRNEMYRIGIEYSSTSKSVSKNITKNIDFLSVAGEIGTYGSLLRMRSDYPINYFGGSYREGDPVHHASLNYYSYDKTYVLSILKFPISYTKDPNLTSILELDKKLLKLTFFLDSELELGYHTPKINLVNNDNYKTRISISSKNNLELGVLEDIEILDGGDGSTIRGKIKLNIN